MGKGSGDCIVENKVHFKIEQIRGLKKYLFFHLGHVVIEGVHCFAYLFEFQ
jgi:hypothetical protein